MKRLAEDHPFEFEKRECNKSNKEIKRQFGRVSDHLVAALVIKIFLSCRLTSLAIFIWLFSIFIRRCAVSGFECLDEHRLVVIAGGEGYLFYSEKSFSEQACGALEAQLAQILFRRDACLQTK